jgi:hypothetical protein
MRRVEYNGEHWTAFDDVEGIQTIGSSEEAAVARLDLAITLPQRLTARCRTCGIWLDAYWARCPRCGT